ncbi:hypothetical protein PG995_010426 [Apiospora arundinis]
MSGLEACGIVLAVIPLFISALEHYKDGKGAFESLLKTSGQLDKLITRLRFQHLLFFCDILNLLRAAAIVEAIGGDPTEAECVRILRDPNNSQHIKAYLGDTLHGGFLHIVRQYETCLKRIAAKLHRIKRMPDAERDDLSAILACNSSEQIAFKGRVSFTMKKASLVELVDDLRDDRLSLKEILKAVRVQQATAPKQASHDAAIIVQTLERVRKAALPLYPAICSACTCDCQEHRVLIRLDHRTPLQGRGTRHMGEMPRNTVFNIMIDSKQQLLEASIEALYQETAAHTKTPHEEAASLVQFKLPVIHISETATRSQAQQPVANICESIREAEAASQNVKFRLVDKSLMAGDHQENQKVHRSYAAASSLHSCLVNSAKDDDLRLTPKQQTLLALEAASSVLQLWQTRWMSLGLTNKTMKLLVSSDEQNAICLSFMEQSIHRYTKDLDEPINGPGPKSALLDLAILLLEIWHHKPLESYATKIDVQLTDSPETRQMVATRWLEKTSDRLPPGHLDAIEKCLAVYTGRLWDWQDKEFQRLYCENIIKPLQNSCNAW